MPRCIPYIFPGLQVFVSWENKHRVIPFPSAQEGIALKNSKEELGGWEQQEGEKNKSGVLCQKEKLPEQHNQEELGKRENPWAQVR